MFGYLAGATALLALAVGFLVAIIDGRDFPTFGDGLWWAVVTLGTVGYDDIVPHTGWGRVVGSVVIVAGVTFISFLTATVTSLFVSADQQELTGKPKSDTRPAMSRRARRSSLSSNGSRRSSRSSTKDVGETARILFYGLVAAASPTTSTTPSASAAHSSQPSPRQPWLSLD